MPSQACTGGLEDWFDWSFNPAGQRSDSSGRWSYRMRTASQINWFTKTENGAHMLDWPPSVLSDNLTTVKDPNFQVIFASVRRRRRLQTWRSPGFSRQSSFHDSQARGVMKSLHRCSGTSPVRLFLGGGSCSMAQTMHSCRHRGNHTRGPNVRGSFLRSIGRGLASSAGLGEYF